MPSLTRLTTGIPEEMELDSSRKGQTEKKEKRGKQKMEERKMRRTEEKLRRKEEIVMRNESLYKKLIRGKKEERRE